MSDVEYITKDNRVLEEVEYGDCYKLEVLYPKWKGLNIWYVTPYPNEDFSLKEPTFILSDGEAYWITHNAEDIRELNKFVDFYIH